MVLNHLTMSRSQLNRLTLGLHGMTLESFSFITPGSGDFSRAEDIDVLEDEIL